MKNRTNPLPAEQETLWIAMTGILGGRLITISVFLFVFSFVMKADNIAFYSFIAFSYIITIPYSLWLRNQERMQRLAPLQFLVDLVFVSGLIYFTDGAGNDFLTLLYPLIILSAGIILPLKQTVQITALAVISYVLVVLLMEQEILIRYMPGPERTFLEIVSAMALRIIIFIFFGAVSAYLSRRCDYISKKDRQLREITQIIFEHVKTGLLLLEKDGNRVLMANDRACTLLGYSEQNLSGKLFSDIHVRPEAVTENDSALKGAADYFRRADGSSFPVSIEEAVLTLPAEAVPESSGIKDSLTTVRVLNFNDLSLFLRLQHRARQLERIEAASRMAAEIAHQVRTPLTGVSVSAQLLDQNLAAFPDHDLLPECHDLCAQIVSETERMNKIVECFLDYTEFSPEEARSLIRMDLDRIDRFRSPPEKKKEQ